MASERTAEAMSFEGALQRLGEIASQLEGDRLELDDSLALFEEGVGLLRFAESVLAGADGRVRQLVEEAGGSIRQDDFPDPL
jgi:exodeoxyribonuclease VII small subunit